EGDRVAVRVRPPQVVVERGVLVRPELPAGRHGRIVHGGDGQADRGRVGAAVPVVDRVRERVGAVVVRGRGVGDGPVGVADGRAVGRLADRGDRERGGAR